MNSRVQLFKYLISDYLSALFSWTLFFIFRKIYIEPRVFNGEIFIDFGSKFYTGLIFIPLFWLFIYFLSGYYRDVYRKSRLTELGLTISNVLLGIIILFFLFIIDDTIHSFKDYYSSLAVLFMFQFFFTYIPRIIITSVTTHNIHRGRIGFNTLIIGGNKKAEDIYLQITHQTRSSGNIFIGFVNVEEKNKYPLEKYLKHLGGLNELRNIINEYNVKEVIIAVESSEHDEIGKILNILIDKNVVIKAIPSMYDILTGKIRMSTIFGTPLIQISHFPMPAWQENIKFFLDKLIACLAIILLLPLCIFLIIGIKLTSKGPIIYSHKRIGRNGKPFMIYKFRSMYNNAEKNGPELSSKDDERITRFGKFMRKARLDEIPNFINVLLGDMSLVGPRPEREYYIKEITKKAPHYVYLLKVRPGITSWGQVKYGYAENVEQMINRLKYDLIYLDNMSLYVDFKILIYTILTIFKGKGI